MANLAISWSRWSDFAQCPRKFFLKYIEKDRAFQIDPKKKGVHLIRGEQLHKQLEDYVNYKLDLARGLQTPRPAMSPETESVTGPIDALMTSSVAVLPETQLAVDAEWKQVEWFDKQAAIRAILDLIAMRSNHAIIWDYKSGKYKPYADECGQLHLSAAMIVALKGFDYVDVSYLFLDEKRPEGIRVEQKDVPRIIKIFDERRAQVNAEVSWAPKRNDYCGFCEATKDKCPNSRKF